jgi:hypothetical protein
MHTYSHKKEHLKVMIIKHSKEYDFIHEYSFERKENLKLNYAHDYSYESGSYSFEIKYTEALLQLELVPIG